jgi:hypothetical protein
VSLYYINIEILAREMVCSAYYFSATPGKQLRRRARRRLFLRWRFGLGQQFREWMT